MTKTLEQMIAEMPTDERQAVEARVAEILAARGKRSVDRNEVAFKKTVDD